VWRFGFSPARQAADRADEEYCTRHNGRNPTRPRRLGSPGSPRQLQRGHCRPGGRGAIGAEGKIVTAGDVAWLTRGDSGEASEVEIRATDKPLRILLYAGRPLHEAVVARGPFVMNTEAEIEQAYADYRAGRFGPI
jgi:hypothetical protein